MHPLPSDVRTLQLLLNGLTGIGPVSARRLQEAFDGDLRRALSADMKALQQVKGLTAPMVASLLRRDFDYAAELERANALNFRILHEGDAIWPASLRQLWDAPLVLYMEGAAVPDERAVAIIGSRHCTPYGAGLARSLARDLAKLGWWIVSGLARGIDFAAHEGALEAEGRTAAILGHGLDLTYPPEAFKLRQRMTERGCVLAEFPLGRPADRQSFPPAQPHRRGARPGRHRSRNRCRWRQHDHRAVRGRTRQDPLCLAGPSRQPDQPRLPCTHSGRGDVGLVAR